MRALGALAVFCLVAFGSCVYSPEPETGVQACGPGPKLCPDGYDCIAGRCWKPGTGPMVEPDAGAGGQGGRAGAGGGGAGGLGGGAGGATTGGTGGAVIAMDGGVDASEDAGVDAMPLVCSAPQKKCGEMCGAISDPAYGCTADSCTACVPPANGTAVCTGTTCDFTCAQGSNKCGTACLPNSPTSCGAGCMACAQYANTVPTCSEAGTCSNPCADGYRDCNGKLAEDGCEIRVDNDTDNCGACGHSCRGGACLAGRCQPVELASLQSDPADVALDGDHVYWAATSDGKVNRVPKLGGATQELAKNQSSPKGVLVADGYVYWSNNINTGGIFRTPVAAPAAPLPVVASEYYPYRMAIHDGTLYYTTDTTSGLVRKVPAVGGVVTDVATSQTSPRGIVVDDARLYWSVFKEVKRVPLGAIMPVVKVSTSEMFPFDLRADASHLYWSDGYAYRIRKALKTATDEATTLADLAFGQSPVQIALDPENVYWANPEGGTIQSVSKQGGAIKTWVSAQKKPVGIAVDETFIFFTTAGDGRVLRLAK